MHISLITHMSTHTHTTHVIKPKTISCMHSKMATSITSRFRFTPTTVSRMYDACILGQPNIDATVTKVNGVVDDYLATAKSLHHGSPNCLIVGFGMEQTPTEDDLGVNTIHLIATINLCIGNRILIYHLPYLPYNVLHPFFSDRNNIFVGVDVKANMQKLNAAFGVGASSRCVDLGERAADIYSRPELKSADLRVLSTAVLGKDVAKPEVGNEWENDLLSAKQVLHACVDAYVPHELGQALVGPTPRVS